MHGKVCVIDPGVGGAIFFEHNGIKICCKMPTTDDEIADMLFRFVGIFCFGEVVCVLEKPPYTAGFNRPAARIAKLFENYAFIKGYLHYLECNLILVNPNEWQKIYKPLPKEYAERKTAIYDAVCKQYPDEKITKYAADAWGIYHWYKTTKGE